jgi:phage terminase large subunit-like protein
VRHVANCTFKEDARGARITKESKASRKRIDAAVCAVMAFDRAAQYEPPKKVNLWVAWV